MSVDFPALGPALPRAAAGTGDAGPVELYRERVQAGLIHADPEQQRVVVRLQRLYEELRHYRPQTGRRGWLWRLGIGEHSVAPAGIYLWGPVGRGKIDADGSVLRRGAAGEEAARPLPCLHARCARPHRARAQGPHRRAGGQGRGRSRGRGDAVVLRRVPGQRHRRCDDHRATVSRVVRRRDRRRRDVEPAPERLYENGLQRDRFLPFIALLGERLDGVLLDSGRDYRLARMRGRKIYHCPNDEAARAALEAAFADLTDHAEGTSVTLTVLARPLVVPRVGRNVAWFTFEELCARPLAAADYLAIAERFAATIVEGIPRLSPQQRNEAQRFHILIDALYEARTLLVASAEVPPEQIYVAGDGRWEFERTVSRLMEMQSEEYIANRRV